MIRKGYCQPRLACRAQRCNILLEVGRSILLACREHNVLLEAGIHFRFACGELSGVWRSTYGFVPRNMKPDPPIRTLKAPRIHVQGNCKRGQSSGVFEHSRLQRRSWIMVVC